MALQKNQSVRGDARSLHESLQHGRVTADEARDPACRPVDPGGRGVSRPPFAGKWPASVLVVMLWSGLAAAGCGLLPPEVVVVETIGEMVLSERPASNEVELPYPLDSAVRDTVVNSGDRMHLVVAGSRCFGSSCSEFISVSCTFDEPDEDGQVNVSYRAVVEVDRSGGCTADCRQGVASCGLVEITHPTMTFYTQGGRVFSFNFPNTIGALNGYP